MKEILVNVANQIKVSGIQKSALIGGAVLTGGGSSMKNIIAAFTKTTGISQVRIAKSISNAVFAKTSGPKEIEEKYIGAISILDEGTQNCCGTEYSDTDKGIFNPETTEGGQTPDKEKEEKPQKEEKKPKGPGFFKRLSDKLQNIGTTIIGDDE